MGLMMKNEVIEVDWEKAIRACGLILEQVD